MVLTLIFFQDDIHILNVDNKTYDQIERSLHLRTLNNKSLSSYMFTLSCVLVCNVAQSKCLI